LDQKELEKYVQLEQKINFKKISLGLQKEELEELIIKTD
jgi:hypothetical protein